MLRSDERQLILSRAAFLVAIAVTLGACDRDDAIVERRAPKGVEVILTDDQRPSHDHEHTHAVANGVAWETPSGWRETPNDNPTRIAVFRIEDAPDAEVVVTRFPGDVGGVLANVNRWRSQIGLAPVDSDSMDSHIERIAVPGFDAYLFVANNEGRGVVAAGLEQSTPARTWFVKATASEGSIGSIRESLIEFVRSFRAAPEND